LSHGKLASFKCPKEYWVANKRFEISKFKFKIPRARTSELHGSFSAVSKPNFARSSSRSERSVRPTSSRAGTSTRPSVVTPARRRLPRLRRRWELQRTLFTSRSKTARSLRSISERSVRARTPGWLACKAYACVCTWNIILLKNFFEKLSCRSSPRTTRKINAEVWEIIAGHDCFFSFKVAF